jgi:hypothetical protein
MHLSVKGSTFNVNSEPYLSERSELRVAGKLVTLFLHWETSLSVLVSVRVWYENPQDSDTNHSVVTQLTGASNRLESADTTLTNTGPWALAVFAVKPMTRERLRQSGRPLGYRGR